MRLALLTSALITSAALLLLAPELHAQDAQKSFTATGASEKAACDAASKQAKDWVKQGKSAGRARSLVDDGKCSCTANGAQQSCKLDVRVTDEQREEEEER
jgi:hypothetical protein